jgi:hypothetical protein
MKFTFWAVGCPLLLFGLDLILEGKPHGFLRYTTIQNLTGFWFWCGFPATVIYWIVRLVRYAWGGGSAPAAPPSSNGSVFGKLN